MDSVKDKLIYLLQNAHAGERAAGFAYRGHGLSVIRSDEIATLNKIEKEEWEHRECLGKMLTELKSGPRPSREMIMVLVGKSISFLCFCSRYLNVFNFGWFMSMYGAGKLERGNIVEYEIAASFARDCGCEHFIDRLLAMAEIEWDHEYYFRTKTLESNWSRYLKVWSSPPSRDAIRNNYFGPLDKTL